VLGGYGADSITGGAGNNLVIGDNGIAMLTGGIVTLVNTTDALSTTGGDDVITLGLGSQTVLGGVGADSITGIGGTNNVVLGDDGQVSFTSAGVLLQGMTTDTLGGADTISLTDGDNMILAGAGGDSVISGPGNDTIIGDFGQADWLAGKLVQVQTSSVAFGGNDSITAGLGNNVVLGGYGSDTITAGGNGNNLVLGDNGSVTLNAGIATLVQTTDVTEATGGGDSITLGLGNNTVLGGAGADQITSGAGPALVLGDNGKLTFTDAGVLTQAVTTDTLGGADIITLGDGNNLVIGGAGADTITTGYGNDTLLGDFGQADWTSAAVLTQMQTSDAAFGGNDSILAGNGNNVVLGGYGADSITGGAGNNLVIGDNGIAMLTGGIVTSVNTTDSTTTTGGGDVLSFGLGAHTIMGGVGADNISGAGGGNSVVLGDDGVVAFSNAGVLIQARTTDTLGGADSIALDGGSNLVIGGAAGDRIATGGGNDTLLGDFGQADWNAAGVLTSVFTTNIALGGNDVLTASDGRNVVIGGFGVDTITSGTGDAMVLGDNGSYLQNADGSATLQSSDVVAATGGDDVIDVGVGRSFVIAGVGSDQATKIGGGEGVMIGDNGVILIDVNGRYTSATTGDPLLGGNDTLLGGSDSDILLGGAGADSLSGNAGDDIVFGDGGEVVRNGLMVTAGSISLFTGGNDSLDGGAGNDLIVGGFGNNLFFGTNAEDIMIGNYGRVVLTKPSEESGGSAVSLVTTGQGEQDLLWRSVLALYNVLDRGDPAANMPMVGVRPPPPAATKGGASGFEGYFSSGTDGLLNLQPNRQSGSANELQNEGGGAPFPGSFAESNNKDAFTAAMTEPDAEAPMMATADLGDFRRVELAASAAAEPDAGALAQAQAQAQSQSQAAELLEGSPTFALAGLLAWRAMQQASAPKPKGLLAGLFSHSHAGRFRKWGGDTHV
jgi:Ca2+-binding RTX toxin-like protein